MTLIFTTVPAYQWNRSVSSLRRGLFTHRDHTLHFNVVLSCRVMLIAMRFSLNVLLILQHPKPSKEAQTGLSIRLFLAIKRKPYWVSSIIIYLYVA